MKNWKQIVIYVITGVVFILLPIILTLGWKQYYSAIYFMIGSWFVGESLSRISSNLGKMITNHFWGNITQKLSLPQSIVGLGSLVMIFGVFLDWFTTEELYYGVTSKSGFETDGLSIGLAGVILLAVAIIRKGTPGKSYSLFSTLWGTYLLFYLFDVTASLETSVFIARDLGAKLGIGPYVSLAGIILVIIGGAMKFPSEKQLAT